MRRWRWPGIVLAAVALIALGRAHVARASTITYSPGYHLVAGPEGTVFKGVVGDLYTLDPQSGQYLAVPADAGVHAGVGYFAYFDGVIAERMGQDQHQGVSVPLAAGAWTMVGNPSAYSPAVVSGADRVYVYDQQGGYLIESSVPPGSGAIAYSAEGGTAVIQPIPGGIDATLADAEDKLVDLSIQPEEVPAPFVLTRADTNGGQNANIPVTFVEEFRPRTAPKPGDAQQSTFIQVNLQQCKDADFASLLLKNTGASQLQQLFGPNAQRVDAVTPPNVGDAASAFRVQLVNGNNRAESYVVLLRRGVIVVSLRIDAPNGKEDTALLDGLAALLDGRLKGGG